MKQIKCFYAMRRIKNVERFFNFLNGFKSVLEFQQGHEIHQEMQINDYLSQLRKQIIEDFLIKQLQKKKLNFAIEKIPFMFS